MMKKNQNDRLLFPEYDEHENNGTGFRTVSGPFFKSKTPPSKSVWWSQFVNEGEISSPSPFLIRVRRFREPGMTFARYVEETLETVRCSLRMILVIYYILHLEFSS
jgi:hypothetical protein